MKNIIPQGLIYFFIAFLIISCHKDKRDPDGKCLDLDTCIKDYRPPCIELEEGAENLLSGYFDQYPICVDDHAGEFYFRAGRYTISTTKKGEPFNPFHPKNIKAVSLGLDITSSDRVLYFTFNSPHYSNTTLTVEKMLDSLGRYNGKELPIVNDLDRNGSYGVYMPLVNYTFGLNNTLQPLFTSNDHSVIWDQYNRWIKLTEFRKKIWPDRIEYDIALDININMYILPRTYYGVLDASFRGHFTIPK